ncbi:MAG: hypothetical protein ACRDV3_16400 [Acidothermaceae bacterium]
MTAPQTAESIGRVFESAVYAFTDDFIDAGVPEVADDLASKGFSAVSLATVYHAARDLLPHNPKRAVAHRDEGAHYYQPIASQYTGPLQPPAVAKQTGEQFEIVVDAITERGMSWQAWTVYLHNSRLAIEHPECAVRNAFGDIYITDLCPSVEQVATYSVELTADVARLSPSLVVAESLHHAGFGHGYHHERAFVPVGAVTGFLLSLCFCESCSARANSGSLDAAALAERVRFVVRAALAGGGDREPELSRDNLAELCGSELLDYLAAREQTVTSLAQRCAREAGSAGVPFGFIDQTGALKGYVSGDPQGSTSAHDAWQLGIAPASVSAAVDSYVVLAYARDAARVARDVAAYAEVTNTLRSVLRHGGVDYLGAENLAEKVANATAAGAQFVDFYHYGLMPLAGLTAAAAAIEAVSARQKG